MAMPGLPVPKARYRRSACLSMRLLLKLSFSTTGHRMRDCEIERNDKVNIARDSDVTIGHRARQHRRKQGNEDHGKLVRQAQLSADRFQRRQLQLGTSAPSMQIQQAENGKYGRVAKTPDGEKRPRVRG